MDAILKTWPKPPTNPTDALLHTLDAYQDSPDTDAVIIATSGMYGRGVRTGLTWGDLRAIAAKLNGV